MNIIPPTARGLQPQRFPGDAIAGLTVAIVALPWRLGTYVKDIPFPVVGFTAGIAVIFASQLKELFGLSLPNEPAAFLPKIEGLWSARDSFNPRA